MLKEALTGRAGLHARVNGVLEILEPLRGGTGQARMCRAYGTRILTGRGNAGLKTRSALD